MEERKKTNVLKKRQQILEHMLKQKEKNLKGIKLAEVNETLKINSDIEEIERKKEEAGKAAIMMKPMEMTHA